MTSTASKLFPHETNRLATGLQILTLAACLSLGAAFVATLWSAPAAPAAATAQTCTITTATC